MLGSRSITQSHHRLVPSRLNSLEGTCPVEPSAFPFAPRIVYSIQTHSLSTGSFLRKSILLVLPSCSARCRYSALIRSCADGLFVCLLGGYLTAFYLGRKLEKIKEKRPSGAWIVRQIGKQKGHAMMLSDAMCHSTLYPYSMSEATVRLGVIRQ